MSLFDWPPLWTLLFVIVATALGYVWSPFGGAAALVGWGVIAVAITLMVWSAVTMIRARTTVVPRQAPASLVTGGPFRFSRNPIYLADLAVVAGCALVVGQPLGLLLVWPLARVLERRFIAQEEKQLLQAFGEDFEQYRREVRRWL